MKRILRSKYVVIILAVLLAVSLLPAFTVQANAAEAAETLLVENDASSEVMTEELLPEESADEVFLSEFSSEPSDEVVLSESLPEPLDFASDTSTRSGDGWDWDKDAATLTLNNYSVNLSTLYYPEDYKSAITLPSASDLGLGEEDDVKLLLVGDSVITVQGLTAANDYRLAILAAGNLTITGDGSLTISADDGANGIEADGRLQIGLAEADDPSDGTRIAVNAMDFSIGTEKDLIINGADIRADIYGTNEDPAAAKIALVGENKDCAEYGVSIKNASLSLSTDGPGTTGVMAYDGALLMEDCYYKQDTIYGQNKVSGIANYNGDVFISGSELDVDLPGNKGLQDVLISAGNHNIDHPAENPCIQIADSTLNGSICGEGVSAFYGGVEIFDSTVNITSTGHAVRTGAGGFYVQDSDLTLNNTADYFSDAVNAFGPISFLHSIVYLSGKGEQACGLTTNSEIIIRGNNTFVDMEGTLAAMRIISTPSVEEAPFRLQDGPEVISGGTMQHVDYESAGADDIIRAFSFSEGTLEAEGSILKNASTHVLIGNPEGLLITRQPEDAVVSYPTGAAFSVEVLAPENVASYQWFATDISGNKFLLDGTSATTDTLIIPSTLQIDNVLRYQCLIKDKNGNSIVTRNASLDLDNRSEDKTVLYIGNYAIEPGEELDLSGTSLGSGKVSFDENGTDIILDNVLLDISVNIYDTTISPSMGLCLDRHNNTENNYRVYLKGKNQIINTFYQPATNASGMTIDFLLWGNGNPLAASSLQDRLTYSFLDAATNQLVHPTILIDGETYNGTLAVSGGTSGIRAFGSLLISADITTTTNGYYYMDGIVCDSVDLTSDHTLDLSVNGAGLSITNGIRMEPGSTIKIDSTAPFVSSGETFKGAIFAGGGLFEIGNGASVSIDCHATPENNAVIGGFAGIILENGAKLQADKSAIRIAMDAEPDPDSGDHSYAAGFHGILGGDGSEITLTDSHLAVDIDSEAIYSALGVYTFADISMQNCAAKINVHASGPVYGLAPEGDLNVSASQLDVQTNYYGDMGLSYALSGDTINLSLENPEDHITADASGEDGIAILAKLDEGGDTPRYYEENYEPRKLLINDAGICVTPKDGEISLTSITGNVNPFVYVETVYDPKDTSRPASKVEIVRNIPLESFELTPASLELPIKDSSPLTLELTPANTTETGFIWTSSDPAVVSVDETGTVTALKYGKATITVTSKANSSLKKTCQVQTRFRDVMPGDVADTIFKYIYWGADEGFINGYSDGNFGRKDNCTRSQFATMIWKLAGSPKAKKKASAYFSDAGNSTAIAWAYENKIIGGYSDGTFRPAGQLTRANFVIMLWKWAGKPAAKKGAKNFSDVPSTHAAYNAVRWASSYGIAGGYSDGTFGIKDNCTRGQIVTMLYKYKHLK